MRVAEEADAPVAVSDSPMNVSWHASIWQYGEWSITQSSILTSRTVGKINKDLVVQMTEGCRAAGSRDFGFAGHQGDKELGEHAAGDIASMVAHGVRDGPRCSGWSTVVGRPLDKIYRPVKLCPACLIECNEATQFNYCNQKYVSMRLCDSGTWPGHFEHPAGKAGGG